MVHYARTTIDATFAAVADPTRRGILERLGAGERSISDLAAAFDMTLTGMKKHVHVLESAGLVVTEKVGRTRQCRVGPARLEEEAMWIATYRAMLDREIRVERTFNASRDRVWKAMTEPELVAQWWGRGNKLVIEKFEPVRGGHWRFVEHADGQEHGFEGRYREVTPPECTVATFEWDGMPGHTLVTTTTLEDLGDGRTKLVAVSLFFTAEERDEMLHSGMEGGMNQSYEALDKVLAQMS